MASGNATTPTTIPARRSERRSRRVYPSRNTERRAAAGRSFQPIVVSEAWYRVRAKDVLDAGQAALGCGGSARGAGGVVAVSLLKRGVSSSLS